MNVRAILVVMLVSIALPSYADRWLDSDPIPDRATAERFANFLAGKIIMIPPYIIHIRKAVIHDRRPKFAQGNRKFTFEVEQDGMFTADLTPQEFNKVGGGVRLYAVHLRGECGQPSFEASPQFAVFEELPESFSVLGEGVFRGLPEALAADLPRIAGRFYSAVPWQLPENAIARVEECRRQFMQKAERFPLESVDVFQGDQKRLVVRQQTTYWAAINFDLGEDWNPTRFVLNRKSGRVSDYSVEVRKGDRWIPLKREGDAYYTGELHQSLICLPPSRNDVVSISARDEGRCSARHWGRVEYRIRYRSQLVKGIAFQHSWD